MKTWESPPFFVRLKFYVQAVRKRPRGFAEKIFNKYFSGALPPNPHPLFEKSGAKTLTLKKRFQ